MHRRVLSLAPVVALLALTSLIGVRAEADEVIPAVPVPDVIGPVGDHVGVKGEPWFDPPFVLAEAQPYPYVSEEFFIDGTARDLIGEAADADYVTRFLVVRPADADDFTGTVVVEWDNVTAQAALNPLFMWDHPYLLREGHAFVSVSAQQVGVSGPSPLAHTQWDPPRYGSLDHPGDVYSYDIYAQAVEVLRQNTTTVNGVAGGEFGETPIPGGATVMGDLAVTNVIATGTSQSASRLHNFVDDIVGISVGNVDGVLLDAGGSRTFERPPVIPTLHFLSEDGLSATEPNAAGASLMGLDNNYRLWEVPAASHADAEFSRYIEDGLYLTHILEAPPLSWAQWDARRVGYRYGDEQSLRAGCQPLGYGDNTYPRRYAARAAMDQLIRWTTSDAGADEATTAPPAAQQAIDRSQGKPFQGEPTEPFVATQPDRVVYDAMGQEVRDANRQVVGGVRLPQIDVPVADYLATTCGLFGHTVGYDPLTLQTLYPQTADYVNAMHEAIDRALAAGALLPADAREIEAQLATTTIPLYREPSAPGDGASAEGASHLLTALMGG